MTDHTTPMSQNGPITGMASLDMSENGHDESFAALRPESGDA